ncbi:replication initiation factor domain-containing protein [Streptococcus anginosus]|uniref:replication initiation factor domain-containing protein n=1 Tax=Streptococcus anginosus TaxID=1328 RepID=UPI0021F84647|nr:replication initiation factor domain-containing protein [Streptococcus anginosus]MCW1052128.1 replication initiation factor domain-containing protein [Streptococcus anginosus]
MKKSIQLSIDEATIIVRPDSEQLTSMASWKDEAEQIILSIYHRLFYCENLGTLISEKTHPAGYQTSYSIEKIPCFLRLAYHEAFPTMGIIIKFSASALDYYRQNYKKRRNQEIDIPEILQILEHENWDVHLSRIDFVADYLNYNFNVNDLYQKVKNKDITIRNQNKIRQNFNLEALEKNGIVSTFYVGSRRKNVSTFLRIYDKKTEQFETNGLKLHIAKDLESWIRFEAVFKKDYARQISEIMKKINSKEELHELIANKILEKFCFIDGSTHELTKFSHDLLKLESNFPTLISRNSRNNALSASIIYHLKNSGLLPLFFKLQYIWGKEALTQFLVTLVNYFEIYYSPNRDILTWLNKHGVLLKELDFYEFLDETIEIFLLKNAILLPSRQTAKKDDKE